MKESIIEINCFQYHCTDDTKIEFHFKLRNHNSFYTLNTKTFLSFFFNFEWQFDSIMTFISVCSLMSINILTFTFVDIEARKISSTIYIPAQSKF